MTNHLKIKPVTPTSHGKSQYVDTPKRPKLVLCGASSITKVKNFGDELLRDIYTNWLAELLPHCELRMLKFDGLRNPRRDWTIDFDSADALVFVGGGYFGEADHREINPIRRSLKHTAWGLRNNHLYGAAHNYALKRKIPHAVIGVEVGPLTNRLYRSQVARILESASVCVVRNPESLQYCREYGVRRQDIDVCADAALSLDRDGLPDESYKQVRAILSEDNSRRSQKTVRLGLHLSSLTVRHRMQREHLIDIVRQFQHQMPSQTNLRLYFLHDQIINAQHPSNASDAERYVTTLFPNSSVISYTSPWALVGVLAAMDAVVTTKLHVGIVARAMSVPVLAIPKHQKTPRFYSMIGEGAYCMPIGEITQDQPTEQLSHILGRWRLGEPLPVNHGARASAESNRNVLARFVHELNW